MLKISEPENPELLAGGPGDQEGSAISPDGAWLAYQSDDSGRFEIYVQPFPGPGPRTRVSASGGDWPRWNPAGGEIFLNRGVMMVAVQYTASGDRFEAGPELDLFQVPTGIFGYDVSTDGRFVVSHPVEVLAPEIHIVTNWTQQFSLNLP